MNSDMKYDYIKVYGGLKKNIYNVPESQAFIGWFLQSRIQANL